MKPKALTKNNAKIDTDLELFRDLINKSNDAIFVNDPQTGLFIFVNDKACASLGYARRELLKMGVMDIETTFPDNYSWRTHADRLRQRGSFILEGMHKRKDGTTIPVEVNVSYVVINAREYMVAVVRDITERKLAEEEIAQRGAMVQQIMDTASVGIGLVDKRGRITHANRRMAEMFGYTMEELIGSEYVDLVHPSERESGRRNMFALLASTIPSVDLERRYQRKDGSEFWGHLACRRFHDAQGNDLGLIGVITDISERKRAEEEQEKLQAQLFQSQKMESVGRLAGGVAHDFNNMLAAILGYTEMAITACPTSDVIHSYLKVIEQSALRSAELVRQLLAFARKQTVAPKVLDLNNTVTGLLKMLQRLMGEDIDFAWLPGTDLWPVKIDTSQLDQLLANLCVNARDAIAGVGKITIETRKTVFDEGYCANHPGFVPGEYVMLAVSDNGCGMNKEVLDHLFEPFFTTKEKGKGTGLGLATVYGIVKQNNGFIIVRSEPGNGSTFSVYLPRVEGEAIEPHAVVTTETPEGHGETVLLVEDDASILNMSKEMLEALGYSVLTADTPGEALLQVKAHAGEIHLLITDVIMPEMNGRDLAKLLSEINPGLKFLFSSGYTSDVIAHRGVLDQGVHFLQKPFSRKDLATKVREALEEE